MKDSPSFPAFAVSIRGDLSFHMTPDTFRTATRLALVRKFYNDLKFYDLEGYRWSIEAVTPYVQATFLNKLLINTVYNPVVSFTPCWRKDGIYELSELKFLFVKAVQLDDDILTQFVEKDELTERIDAAQSVDDLVSVAKWMEEDHSLEVD